MLSKSGQFNHYKDNCSKLENENSNLKEELDFLNQQIKDLEDQILKNSKINSLNKIRNEDFDNLKIAIKSPSPRNSNNWGDYFFALALKKSFEKKGFSVEVHEKEDWYGDYDDIDINFVLRGNYEFNLSNDKVNIMWNISHPERISMGEYEEYDIIFISSIKNAQKIDEEIDVPARPLLQCCDPEVFFPQYCEECAEDILFVGTARGHIFRQIVKDAMLTHHDVAIYGTAWDEFLDKEYIKGAYIPNEEVHKYYSSCKILLNDHWETMRINDFPSNRLFDGLACGAFIISDDFPSAESLFEGNIITYDTADDLNEKIEYYLTHDDERRAKAEKGREFVLKNHTFDNRVDEIINCLKKDI